MDVLKHDYLYRAEMEKFVTVKSKTAVEVGKQLIDYNRS